MNDNAKAWVEALRSGEYKQGREYLHRGDRFCCLGVACKLAAEAGVVADVVPLAEPAGVVQYNRHTAVLSGPVMDWLGLKTRAGTYVAGNHRCASLSARNDSGVSFKRISDIIESEPKGLFEGES